MNRTATRLVTVQEIGADGVHRAILATTDAFVVDTTLAAIALRAAPLTPAPPDHPTGSGDRVTAAAATPAEGRPANRCATTGPLHTGTGRRARSVRA